MIGENGWVHFRVSIKTIAIFGQIVETSTMENFQTTPFGLWKRAKEYSEGAKAVAEKTGDQLPLLAYYLCGHSIELSLKSFLLSCGVPIQTLSSRDFGHNLQALVDEARRYKIEEKVYLYPRELGEISVLNDEYKAKRFEYHETETYCLPHIDRAKRIAERLVCLLEPTQLSHRKIFRQLSSQPNHCDVNVWVTRQ